MAADRAVLIIDNRFDEGEAETESGLVTAWVGPVVAFEDLLLFVRRNPDSRVGYLKFDDAGLAGCRDADPTAFGRVFDGVVEEVSDELLDVEAVSQDQEVFVLDLRLENLVLGVGDEAVELGGLVDFVGDVDEFAVGAAKPRGDRGDLGVRRDGGEKKVARFADVRQHGVLVAFVPQRGFRIVADVRQGRLDVMEEIAAEVADLALTPLLFVEEPVEGEGEVAKLGDPSVARDPSLLAGFGDREGLAGHGRNGIGHGLRQPEAGEEEDGDPEGLARTEECQRPPFARGHVGRGDGGGMRSHAEDGGQGDEEKGGARGGNRHEGDAHDERKPSA